MVAYTDLFGDISDDTPRGKGRPKHVATDQNRFKIMILQSLGKTQAQIAKTIGVSVPTLKDYYSSILKSHKLAAEQEFAARTAALWMQGADGNVSAYKEFDRLIEKALMKSQGDMVLKAAPQNNDYIPKSQKKIDAAAAAASASGGWNDLITNDDVIN